MSDSIMVTLKMPIALKAQIDKTAETLGVQKAQLVRYAVRRALSSEAAANDKNKFRRAVIVSDIED